MNGSLDECKKEWLRRSLDDIKKAVWVDGRMGNGNVNATTEKWKVKNLVCLFRRL